LGTPGLIAAYREAARLAIEEGEIIECHQKLTFEFNFPYLAMNDVMKVVKSSEVDIVSQIFDNSCNMTLSMRADLYPEVTGRLLALDGVSAQD
jgi:putative IMPACT (imprinted ancient) family translation regulator